MWATQAREEHDAFAAQLRDHGVTVHHFGDLLAEALDAAGCAGVRAGPADDGHPLRAGARRAARRAGRARPGRPAGRVARRRGAEARPGRPAAHVEPAAGVPRRRRLPAAARCPTTCSSGTTRRGSTAGCRSTRWPSAPGRRETINSRVVYNFHPMFRAASVRFLYGNDALDHGPATVEGGDILVLGNGAVMIGMGERTTPQGAECLARALFANGERRPKVIVVELPKTRAFMHLDTAMTMVDRDAFCVVPATCPTTLRSFTLTAGRRAGPTTRSSENADLLPVVAEALGVDKVRVLRTPIDRRGAEREQWDDGNNFLAVAPGVVLGYERNTTTNTLPARGRHRGRPHRRLGARPRPRRPSLHDLPHRTRRGGAVTATVAGSMDFDGRPPRPQLHQGARLHAATNGSSLLDLAARSQARHQVRASSSSGCAARNIALIFEKTSTRTRCAFEVAAHDQGAHVTYLDPPAPSSATRSPPRTPAACSAGIFDGIEYRGSAQDTVEALAAHCGRAGLERADRRVAPHPVALRLLSPCTSTRHGERRDLVRLLWRRPQQRGQLAAGRRRDAAAWTYGSSRPKSLAGTRRRRQASAQQIAEQHGGADHAHRRRRRRACTGVDFVYTDVWVSMGEPERGVGRAGRAAAAVPGQRRRSWPPPATRG